MPDTIHVDWPNWTTLDTGGTVAYTYLGNEGPQHECNVGDTLYMSGAPMGQVTHIEMNARVNAPVEVTLTVTTTNNTRPIVDEGITSDQYRESVELGAAMQRLEDSLVFSKLFGLRKKRPKIFWQDLLEKNEK